MTEHEAIEDSACRLLADLADDRLSNDEVAARLDALAGTIEDHIGVEETVVAGVDPAGLSGPWVTAWVDGVDEFDRLKADWMLFLRTWDAQAIAIDRPGFHDAAEPILSRLRERLRLETQAFYATALQTGAIALR